MLTPNGSSTLPLVSSLVCVAVSNASPARYSCCPRTMSPWQRKTRSGSQAGSSTRVSKGLRLTGLHAYAGVVHLHRSKLEAEQTGLNRGCRGTHHQLDLMDLPADPVRAHDFVLGPGARSRLGTQRTDAGLRRDHLLDYRPAAPLVT